MRLSLRSGAALAAALGLATLCVAADTSQPMIQVKGKEPIPRDRFKTWSLFLMTNQAWLTKENAGLLEDLYQSSRIFGRVIGDDHLAVWFWKADGTLPYYPWPAVGENVDVERAIAYCQKLGLKPSRGPYLLFTTTYPDETIPPSAFSVIEIGGSVAEIRRLLERLGDQLFTEGVIRKGEFRDAPTTDAFWTAWFDATRRALMNAGFTSRVSARTPTLSLDSGPTK